MLRKFLSDYLSFTRKERTGIIVLVAMILFFTILPFLFPYFISHKPPDHTAFEKDIATLKIKQTDSSRKFVPRNFNENNYLRYYPANGKKYYEKQPAGELFYFDPNTLSAEGWEKLGVRDKTINTIRHYLSKGGKFHKPEDIGKIWGLHEYEVKRLMPYVAIPQETSSASNEKKSFENKIYINPKHSNTPVDINTADTIGFTTLPGIGNRLAYRIVNFRDKLGGFYKVEQVAETFALPDSTFQKIKARLVLANPAIKQININTATVDQLKIHPYIRYNLANAIVQYRTQHGKFGAVSDIKKIMLVTDEIYNKTAPYLSVE